jgi:nucleolin
MEVQLFVGNLAPSTTEAQLTGLFGGAGDVTAVRIMTHAHGGASRGYGFVTMSALSEADKAVSMFNTYSLDNHDITVSLARPRSQRGFAPLF